MDPLPACHPAGRDCPAAWTVLDLNGLEVGEERWVYEGSLLRGEPPLERHGQGTCPGSTGFNDLFSFVAPRMGTYVIETQGDIGDTILWARTECGISGAAAELACNDDGPRGWFSQVCESGAPSTDLRFRRQFWSRQSRPYTPRLDGTNKLQEPEIFLSQRRVSQRMIPGTQHHPEDQCDPRPTDWNNLGFCTLCHGLSDLGGRRCVGLIHRGFELGVGRAVGERRIDRTRQEQSHPNVVTGQLELQRFT